MGSSEATIVTRSLSTGYMAGKEKIFVTEGLNASLDRGRLVCLLGPNGAGKSTLLRTLAGFQAPLIGEVLIMGHDPRAYSSREMARILSVVLTERPVLENMDVRSLVALGRTPYTDFWGRLKRRDNEAVDKAMGLIGIESLSHRLVPTLSDGERQKVMIAKAFAQETPIIFLDEPTAFLDYPSKVEIMLLLHSLAHTHSKTIFMSTHDLDIALQIADDLWLLDRTLGVKTGTRHELTEAGDVERYFSRPGIYFDYSDGLFKIEKFS